MLWNVGPAKKSVMLSITSVNSSIPLIIGSKGFLGSKPNASPSALNRVANRPSSLSKNALSKFAVVLSIFLSTGTRSPLISLIVVP